jgi:hypothetical protein
MIKSRRIRKVGHVARMGEMKNVYKILVGKPEYLGVDGKIIFKLILREWGLRMWIRFM